MPVKTIAWHNRALTIIDQTLLPSEYREIPLTTVDQRLESQLRAVMDLLSRPAAPPPTQSFVVVPDLVVRASCAPPPME